LVKNKYAIIILAAGNSTRLGYPKQLVSWNQTTLLNHAIDHAARVKNSDIYVTLGGHQKEVIDSIVHDLSIFVNPFWEEGMGSTISYTMDKIAKHGYEGIILSVCDQPYISHHIFIDLIEAFQLGNNSIIISKYDTSSGPPTLFSKVHFKALANLRGDDGAKKIVKNNISHLGHIDFNQGHIDIDTENDLKQLDNEVI
jgi:molybdenum cofactor cytidylyltransferase